ncbi:ABC transporter permease [Bordetella genomosp. 13]|uniref:Transport permease protein n=1 Tax=Bordetella genomosp. 13 TaxID=463040 RepID=A0A1W6ZI45_9BORD|nr:ABC transporter permease [Bordetella genomosp. 13]ARP96982.1 sugar ABC transporter permease [Bordetella genomosp. 13]
MSHSRIHTSNPSTRHRATPLSLLKSIIAHWALISSLVRREVVGRYRGSALGLLWSFFNPIFMLLVYTFVFSVVFKARWPGGTESRTEFALVLFAGLIVFNFFAECINRAPSLILSNVNYVKKVVFPLEILPCVAVGSALFHLLISLAVWLAFYLVFYGMPFSTALLFPVVVLPLVFMILGLSWFLAALGVYLRDVTQFIGILTTVLMFVSPVFYSPDVLPEQYRWFLHLSPLTMMVEQGRGVLFWGRGIDWFGWGAYSVAAAIVALLGYAWFQKTRRGFADVL